MTQTVKVANLATPHIPNSLDVSYKPQQRIQAIFIYTISVSILRHQYLNILSQSHHEHQKQTHATKTYTTMYAHER